RDQRVARPAGPPAGELLPGPRRIPAGFLPANLELHDLVAGAVAADAGDGRPGQRRRRGDHRCPAHFLTTLISSQHGGTSPRWYCGRGSRPPSRPPPPAPRRRVPRSPRPAAPPARPRHRTAHTPRAPAVLRPHGRDG